MRHLELISILADRLGMSRYQARRLVNTYIALLVEGIEVDGAAQLHGLGSFHLRKVTYKTAGTRGKIKFAASSALRKRFADYDAQRRSIMDKYGVTLDDKKAVEARVSKKCPDCGADLDMAESNAVPICPNCGTKPFEPKDPSNG